MANTARLSPAIVDNDHLLRVLESGLVKGYRSDPPPKRLDRRGGASCGKGKAMQWLLDHVSYEGKKCLFWPFSKDGGRPAGVGYQGKVYKSSRLMCCLAHGLPPSEQYVAAYSCGRSHRGCINPSHMSWKTEAESLRDQYKNGRTVYGRQGKLTFAIASEIRSLETSQPKAELAKRYGISTWRLYSLLRGDGYRQPVKPREVDGRYYSKIVFKGQFHWLGSFGNADLATAAYDTALERLRRGETPIPSTRQRVSAVDIARFYTPPPPISFGDREGEVVVPVAAQQEQSVFILQAALDGLHPKVKRLILVASETGDLTEAAEIAGLSSAEVTTVLPLLKVFLARRLDRA